MSPRWTVTPSWKRSRPAGFIAPCLPVLVDEVPAGPDWLHELNWDGYRIVAKKDGANVKVWSRNARGWQVAFPAIVAAIAELPAANLMLDGEAVVLREDGSADFFALRSRVAASTARLVVFDLLQIEGLDTRPLPLEERRERLEAALDRRPSPSLMFSLAVDGDEGAVLFQHACAMNLEGIVSKQKGSPYRSGPTSTWRKTRCPGYTRAGEEGE